MPTVVSVLNQKGGSGKTAIATNLAAEIGDVLGAYSLPMLDGPTNHRKAYAEVLYRGTTVLDMPGAM